MLETLVRAHDDNEPIHGWAIMKATGRAGPTVYKVLDRLEEARWVTGEWEALAHDQPGPRRRFYRLTGEGERAARALLAQRRPATLMPPRPAAGSALLSWFHGGPAGDAR
ncbi:PadR family transcriptional regulator [Nonomuraea sp. NPDC050153]|uniref:PadR family transcriptional regulator n=1 Tax=Nonomuraea sp. NPDC050153 TaxID=3364359 RepID=UPI0037B2D10C